MSQFGETEPIIQMAWEAQVAEQRRTRIALRCLEQTTPEEYLLSGVAFELLGDVAERVSGHRVCTIHWDSGKPGWKIYANHSEWYFRGADEELFALFREEGEKT